MKKLFIYILVSSCTFASQAQSTTSKVIITILQPTQNQNFQGTLSDLSGIADRFQAQLLFTGIGSVRVNLTATLANISGTVTLFTRTSSAVELQGGVPFILNSSNLEGFFDPSTIEADGVDKNELILGGFLPEGVYRLCVKAYDASVGNGLTTRLSDPGQSGCINLIARYPEPPKLITIGGRAIAPGMDVIQDPFNIIWIPSTVMGTTVSYNLRIADLGSPETNPEAETLDANVAFDQSRQPTYQQTTFSTNMRVGLGGELVAQLEIGHRYAVRVEATAANGSGIKNNGYSVVADFWYRGGARSSKRSGIIPLAFPSEGYMPFRGIPVVLHLAGDFKADTRDVSRLKTGFKITGASSGSTSKTRDIKWYEHSPLETQQLLTGNSSITADQASRISLSHSSGDGNLYRYYDFNNRGEKFTWSAGVEVFDETARRTNTQDYTVSGSFTAGMGKPLLNLPKNESTQEIGKIIFKYKTAEPIDFSNAFLYDVVQADGEGIIGGFDVSINEKAILEVSSTNNFTKSDSILFTKPMTLKETILSSAMNDENVDWANISSRIYHDEEATFNFTKNGTYYWRVKWLKNPDDANAQDAYLTSDTWSFKIGDGVTVRDDDEDDDNASTTNPNECLLNCVVEIPESTEAAVISAGTEIKIGHYTLKVASATLQTTGTYDGTGVISDYSLMGYKGGLKVTFTNLKVQKKKLTGEQYEIYAIDGGAKTVNNGGELLNLAEMALGQPISAPFGVNFTVFGYTSILELSEVSFTPRNALAKLRVALHLPSEGMLPRNYDLVADNVCMVPGGFGGTVRLYLNDNIYGDQEADPYQFYIKGGGDGVDRSTFVQFKCDSISVQLAGGILFPRTKLLPENEQGVAIAGQVDASFLLRIDQKIEPATPEHATVTTSGMVAGLTFNHPFQIVGHEDWGFRITDAFIDLSDLTNAPDMKFPKPYQFTWLAEDQQSDPRFKNNWKGLYCKRLGLRLPKNFTNDQPKIFDIEDLLIDETGVTVSVEGKNLLSKAESGWSFTIDTLALSMIQVKPGSGSYAGTAEGQILLPIFDEGSELKYKMILSSKPIGGVEEGGAKYICTVNTGDHPLNMSIWKAKVVLDTTSMIELLLAGNSKARLKCKLNGSFDITPATSGGTLMGLSTKEIRFEGFGFDTDTSGFFTFDDVNYDKANGVLSFASPQHSAGGLPISITKMDFVNKSSEGIIKPGLNIGADLTLSDMGFKASLDMTIVGKLKMDGVKVTDVGFDDFQVNAITVDGEFSAFSMHGEVRHYKDDPTYGQGYAGNIAVKIPMKISGSLTARFGSKGEAGTEGYYSYWYVDGMINLAQGVTLGALTINAFGGGAWHNMTLQNPNAMDPEHASVKAQEALKLENSPAGEVPPSGLKFIPSQETYLGLRAGIVASITGSKTVFNMDVSLLAEFTTSGGLNKIAILGKGYLLQELDKRDDAPMVAAVDIQYSHNGGDYVFDGKFSLMVNFYDVLRGRLPGDTAGTAKFHLDHTGEWYFYLGEPEARAGLIFNKAGIDGDLNGYFMLGYGIPSNLPPLPDFIRTRMNQNEGHLANGIRSDDRPSNRVPAMYESGKGIAFGAALDIKSDWGYWIFYASLRMVLGFDINISQDGGRVCDDGRVPGTASGWFGQGQAYAGIEGSIGIYVDLLFVEDSINIATVGAVISMVAKLPNPEYFAGTASLYYSLLDGYISGDCNFKFEIGENCVVTNSSMLDGMQLIQDMQPTGTNVSTLSDVKTLFTFPIDKELELEEITAENEVLIKKFKPYIKKYELYKKKNGTRTLVDGQTTRMEQNNKVALRLHADALESFTEYEADIDVRVLAYVNNQWVPVKRNDVEFSEKKTVTFKTTERPATLLENESWPFANERFFLQNSGLEPIDNSYGLGGDDVGTNFRSRGKKGYIKVGQQRYLFQNTDDGQYAPTHRVGQQMTRSVNYRAIFTPESGAPLETAMEFIDGVPAIEFAIPQLTNSTTYRIDIVRRINNGVRDVDLNEFTVREEIKEIDLNNRIELNTSLEDLDRSTVRIKTSSFVGQAKTDPPERIIYSYRFRTSQYNNHREKLATIAFNISSNVTLGMRSWSMSSGEKFEKYDLPATINQAQHFNPSEAKLLYQLTTPDIGKEQPAGIHWKFKIYNSIRQGYIDYLHGVAHDTKVDNGHGSYALPSLSNATMNYFSGYVRSKAFALPVSEVLVTSPYFASTGLAEPLSTSQRGNSSGIVAPPRAMGVATATTAAQPPQLSAPALSVSADDGIPKTGITDAANLMMLIQFNAMLFKLYDVNDYVPNTTHLSQFSTAIRLLTTAERLRLTNMLELEDDFRTRLNTGGRQRVQFRFWVPTIYGPYPTAPVIFTGIIP